jgi:predicted dehydrogenase
VGEVCHFVDLVQALTGSLPVRAYAEGLKVSGYGPDENVLITLHMENGSVGSICYVANGDKASPRERVELFGGGAVGTIDNFRSVSFTRGGRMKSERKWNIDRGYGGELEALLEMARDGVVPVPFRDYVATTLATFAIEEALRTGAPVPILAPLDLE